MMDEINTIQDNIIEEISGLNDWIDFYEYLIKLGKEFKAAGEGLKTEENLISGCQSSLWLDSELKNGRVIYRAQSDALITRGILALILRVLNNRRPGEIVSSELYFIYKTGLKEHLSPARSKGLSAILKRMKEQASGFMGTGQTPERKKGVGVIKERNGKNGESQ